MEQEGAIHETPAQAEWGRRLRGGRAVWLYRHPGAYVAATLTGLLAVGFIYPTVRMAWLGASGRAEVLHREYNVSTLPLLLFLVAFTSFMAAVMWRLLVQARVRFAGATLEYTNWCGSRRGLALSDLIAAAIFTQLARRGGVRHRLKVCELTPGTEADSRWVSICGGLFGVRVAIAEVVLRELMRRCELSELSPASGAYGAEIWQRSGRETDLPPAT